MQIVKKRSGLSGNILLFVFALVLSALCIEVGLRLYYMSSFSREFINADKIEGKTLYFWTIPGKVVMHGDATTILNKQGFRGHDFEQGKEEGVTRIAIIGDSFTFGTGINNTNDTYPERLEYLLNEGNKKYEVMNFGVPGANILEILWLFRYRALGYNPDIIVYSFFKNDLHIMPYNIPIDYCNSLGSGMQRSYFVDFVRVRLDTKQRRLVYNAMNSLPLNYSTFTEEGNYIWDCFRDAVHEMGNTALEKNITLIAIEIPNSCSQDDIAVERKLNKQFSRENISVIDGFTDRFCLGIKDLSESDIVFNNGHYKEYPNFLIAGILRDKINGMA